MTRPSLVAVVALAIGCAASPDRAPAGPPAIASPDLLIRRADASAARGDHAGASAYFEAALDAGASEERVLPRLVTSLVRAGELRRSLAPISRLRALHPEDGSLAALDATVRSLLGGGPAAAEPEVRR
jgi:hypothetical protein